MESLDDSKSALALNSMGKGSKRRPWRAEEDEAIRCILEQNQNTRWSVIAEKLRNSMNAFDRTGKQCRERWQNHLSPNVKKTPWKIEEELILFESRNVLGNKWAEISSTLPGRSDGSIKNRFYSTLKKQFRKVNGFDASPKQLKKSENQLCVRVINALVKKDLKRKGNSFSLAMSAFFDANRSFELAPPELPKLFPIEISEFVVTGQKIDIPETVCALQDDYYTEFLYTDNEQEVIPFNSSN